MTNVFKPTAMPWQYRGSNIQCYPSPQLFVRNQTAAPAPPAHRGGLFNPAAGSLINNPEANQIVVNPG